MSKRNKLAAAAAAAMALTFGGAAFAQASQGQAQARPTPARAAGVSSSAPSSLQNAGPDEVFARWDKDKNKMLSLVEFRAGFEEVQTANALRKLHQQFTTMDRDKSNALEANEFANLEVVKKGGPKAPVMSAFDEDKNGKLEFKEYVGMITTVLRNK